MKFKSPISIRVGDRSELDRKFSKCIESLPEETNLSEDIKRRYVLSFELEEEKSEIEELKERISRQESMLRGLEAKIHAGVIVEKEEKQQKTQDIDEEKKRQVQELAASMTDW